MTIRIERWGVVYDDHPYRAPETLGRCLVGRVHGHPRHEDGKRIKTSVIVAVAGRRIETASGSTYELGEVHSEYLDWLKSQGRSYDEERPIRMEDGA